MQTWRNKNPRVHPFTTVLPLDITTYLSRADRRAEIQVEFPNKQMIQVEFPNKQMIWQGLLTVCVVGQRKVKEVCVDHAAVVVVAWLAAGAVVVVVVCVGVWCGCARGRTCAFGCVLLLQRCFDVMPEDNRRALCVNVSKCLRHNYSHSRYWNELLFPVKHSVFFLQSAERRDLQPKLCATKVHRIAAGGILLGILSRCRRCFTVQKSAYAMDFF